MPPPVRSQRTISFVCGLTTIHRRIFRTFLTHPVVTFLGYTISPDGVRPNSNEVAALAKMPMPETVTQLRAKLGYLSCYRKFLPNMAEKVRSLSSLLNKEAMFVFTDEMELIVRGLLADLATPPALVHCFRRPWQMLKSFMLSAYVKVGTPLVSSNIFDTPSKMPSSRSKGVQWPSGTKVARLMETMGRINPSDCVCSSVPPKPSLLASQYRRKGREPSVTASQFG